MADQIVIHSFVQPFLPRVKIAYPLYQARSSTEPTASALSWRAIVIGQRPSVKGWKRRGNRVGAALDVVGGPKSQMGG